MKLWLLRPVAGLEAGDDPWDPWYDKCFGFVVRAETEQNARDLADESSGDENREKFGKTCKTYQPWRDEKYSICIELTKNGDSGIIINDFASA